MSAPQMAELVLQRLERAHPGMLHVAERHHTRRSLERSGWVDAGHFPIRHMELVKQCKQLLSLGSEVLVFGFGATGATLFVRMPDDQDTLADPTVFDEVHQRLAEEAPTDELRLDLPEDGTLDLDEATADPFDLPADSGRMPLAPAADEDSLPALEFDERIDRFDGIVADGIPLEKRVSWVRAAVRVH